MASAWYAVVSIILFFFIGGAFLAAGCLKKRKGNRHLTPTTSALDRPMLIARKLPDFNQKRVRISRQKPLVTVLSSCDESEAQDASSHFGSPTSAGTSIQSAPDISSYVLAKNDSDMKNNASAMEMADQPRRKRVTSIKDLQIPLHVKGILKNSARQNIANNDPAIIKTEPASWNSPTSEKQSVSEPDPEPENFQGSDHMLVFSAQNSTERFQEFPSIHHVPPTQKQLNQHQQAVEAQRTTPGLAHSNFALPMHISPFVSPLASFSSPTQGFVNSTRSYPHNADEPDLGATLNGLEEQLLRHSHTTSDDFFSVMNSNAAGAAERI